MTATSSARSFRTRFATLAAGLSLLLLTGCVTTEDPGQTSDATSTDAATSDAATPDESAGACGGLSAAEALAEYGSELAPYDNGHNQVGWSLKDEFTLSEAAKTYDPCAELSSITVTIEHGTISTPAHVMLFHHDEYLGTATENPVIYSPTTERLADDSIEVTFMWPLEGESYVDASGNAVSVFTWDETSQSVVHTGEFPPE